ncbi:MAG: YciI family protein, partial [Kangiellaceae bacterium]|nr:YciI family protein [Kangiellaceae bacterium]
LLSIFSIFVLALWTHGAVSEASNVSSDNKVKQKLFAVEIKVGSNWDKSKSPSEQRFFKEHSVNLQQLRKAGHIVMGARYSDIGLIIFSANSADEVKAFMEKDPSMSAGTFKYEVHPLNVFYPGMVGTKRSN